MSRSKGVRTGSDAIVSSPTVDMTECERDWFDQMRVAIRCTSDANLIRMALYRMAWHLDLKIGTDVFACRPPRNAAKPTEEALEVARVRRLQRTMRTPA